MTHADVTPISQQNPARAPRGRAQERKIVGFSCQRGQFFLKKKKKKKKKK
jgi:hypothetical protein